MQINTEKKINCYFDPMRFNGAGDTMHVKGTSFSVVVNANVEVLIEVCSCTTMMRVETLINGIDEWGGTAWRPLWDPSAY